jgi:hypothetical protein
MHLPPADWGRISSSRVGINLAEARPREEFLSAEMGVPQTVLASCGQPNLNVNQQPRKGQNMIIHANKNLAIHAGLALALGWATWSPAVAQTPEPAKAKKMTMEGKTTEHSRMEHSKKMMAHCQDMMAAMKVQDAELAAQVAGMNSAPAESKMELMAGIITKMVEHQAAMHARMADMQMEMMKHMEMGEGAMTHHPMMKDMDKKPGEMPKDHK